MTLIQSGIRTAKIIVVGEAPGAEEARHGKPFIGGAGHVLDTMLQQIGLARYELFITNLCHERPPDNQFEWFYKKENLGKYLRGVLQLKTDIEQINPNLIIALGNHPLKALTGKVGITKWRGSVLPCTLAKGHKVLCTYHPAAIMRTWDLKGVATIDLSKAIAESKSREIIYPKRKFYIPNGKVIYRFGTDWLTDENPYDLDAVADTMATSPWLSVDIECVEISPGNWRLDCVGFSNDPSQALVLDAGNKHALELIRRLCACPARKIYQNGTFDMTVLKQNGIETTNFAWDTMLAHHALYPECASSADEVSSLSGRKRQSSIGKGLGFLTTFYTREPFYKDDGKLWKGTGDKDQFYRYNALDCAVTYEIKTVQDVDLAEFGTMETAQREFGLVNPLMHATNTGIRIDVARRKEIKDKLQGEIDNLQAFLNAGAGRAINVKSPKDVPDLLYNVLHLPPQRNKKTKRITADADAIIKLAEKNKNPLLHTIIKIRERRDLIERYANAPIDSDNRMRCSFDITGTRSGRLSSRISIFGSGTNLQTIPEYMREMFIADEGCVFIYRDFSQAEARIVACLSHDDYLIDLFNDPSRDIHRETAAKIFNKAPEEITDAERYLGKKVRHAVNYGMDAARFVEVVNQDSDLTGISINLATARRVIDGFFLLHANHKSVYWGTVERELNTTRQLNTPFGRKRTFFGRWNDALLREAYSYKPQSTIGDLCNQAVINMWDRIMMCQDNVHWGAQVLLSVHDSILVQCYEEYAQDVAGMMADCMRIPLNVEGHQIIIPTDCKVGYNWGNRSKDGLTNPRGLRDINKWIAEHAET